MAKISKKEVISKAGKALFLRFGIKKVSVEEVCERARVSKRTFYKYFHNKDDLAVHVLSELFAQSRASVEAVLSLDCPIEDKMSRIIAVKSKLASKTSAAFYRETMEADTEAGRFAVEQQHKWDERVRRFYKDSQAQGRIRADIDVDVLMFLLTRVRDLVKDPELARLTPDFSTLVETVMKVFFYGIVPRQGKAADIGAKSKGETENGREN